MSFSIFATPLMAEAAATGPAAAPNGIMSFLPLILIFAVFYFLMIRPQKKKMEEEQSMNKQLSNGDEIYTKSGFLGTVAGLTDSVVTLEIAPNVKIKVLRTQVGGLSKKLFEEKPAGPEQANKLFGRKKKPLKEV